MVHGVFVCLCRFADHIPLTSSSWLIAKLRESDDGVGSFCHVGKTKQSADNKKYSKQTPIDVSFFTALKMELDLVGG